MFLRRLLWLSVLAFLIPALVCAAEPARVIESDGSRLVIQGAAVADLLPHMPVWILEHDGSGKPALLLAEGVVRWVQGERAVVEIADKDVGRMRPGALVEPRFQAEARLYHQTLQADKAAKEPQRKEIGEAVVRVRHRVPRQVSWGKNLWLEAMLEGPADKLSVMYRLGDTGAYTELAMVAKGDALFGAEVPVGESDPAVRTLEYYLVATATGIPKRIGVHGNPAEPDRVAIDSVPEPTNEQLVQHGPIDRGSHRRPIEITAQVNKRFSHPTLLYRARGSGAYLRVPMRDAGSETWAAEIPARDVVTPGIAYYITVMDEKGIVRDGFATGRSPQNVTVLQPQILSAEENRNQLSIRWQRVDFGGSGDRYNDLEVGIERLFFGFLVARINGGYLSGRSLVAELDAAAKATGNKVPGNIGMKRGRAGLDVHMGDYVSVSGDVAMAISSSSGLGYRLGLRLGDEQVATIDGVVEKIYDLKSGKKVVDVYRGALAVPVVDGWRLQGIAVFESILQASSDDKGLRLLLGVEHDLGDHVVLSAYGGLAGRLDAANGPDVGAGARLKF